MVPNNVVLSAAIVPLREPASVDLRARLRPDVRPSDVQTMLEDAISTPTRGEPNISLEEIDADEVVVRIQAIPLSNADGPKLADEVLAAVAGATELERQRRLALASVCPRPIDSDVLTDPELALHGADRAGRQRRQQRPRAQRQRRDVELGTVVLDRLHDGPRDVVGALGARRRAGACRRSRRTCPRRG